MEIVSPTDPGSYCERCGEGRDLGPHAGCGEALKLEPPRYCRHCARRMVVQVTPSGWKADCTRHGTRATAARP